MNNTSSSKPPFVLVIGSTGFLGSRLVEMLLDKGYRVRAMARKTSNIDKLKRLNVGICYGDINDPVSLESAFDGINFVVHAAAETKNDTSESLKVAMSGVRNIVSLSKRYNVDNLVYISSCSVYGVSELTEGQVVDEGAPLEKRPEKRGFYSEAKLKAEILLADMAVREHVPFTCLRPGTIYGERGEIFTPMMGFSFGTRFFIIINNGDFILPLVYIDNLVEAIILAIANAHDAGQTYNVIDSDRITKKEYVNILLRKLYPKAVFMYFPYLALYGITYLQEVICTLTRRKPFLTRYRLVSSQRNIVYDSSKIRKELGWNPSITFREAVSSVAEYEKAKRNG